jgi:hypothetical protein
MKNQLIGYTAFAILTLLWLAFGIALVFNQEMLLTVWQLFRGWPLVGQLLVTLLTLPVVAGLWIWNTSWPVWLRLILVIGLALMTIYTFFPKKTAGQTGISHQKYCTRNIVFDRV